MMETLTYVGASMLKWIEPLRDCNPRTALTVTVLKGATAMANIESTPEEDWRAIPGFEDYEVSSLGGVRRRTDSLTTRAGKVMKIKLDQYGYCRVSLRKDNKYHYFGVHCLVLMAFVGPRPTNEHQAAHRDGARANNILANLRWATPKENAEDRVRHGTLKGHRLPGSLHLNSKLNEQSVIQIKQRVSLGERPSDLAAEFGVSRPTISDLLHGRTWGHVQ